MASEIQKNLVEKNAEYARTFDKGDLALPPAKKYLVGKNEPGHNPLFLISSFSTYLYSRLYPNLPFSNPLLLLA